MSTSAVALGTVRRTSRNRFLLVFVLAPALFVVGACSSNPVGPVIGEILHNLASDVQAVINDASSSANALALAASSNAQVAIDNAASAFGDQLDKSLNQVSDSTKQAIIKLQETVQELASTSVQVLQKATDDAQQIVNTLPFGHLEPQLTSFTPRSVVKRSGPNTLVDFHGNFFYASQARLTPTLAVAGVTLQPSVNTTNELGFEVPLGDFPEPVTGLGSTPMTLNVPYQSGIVIKSTRPGTFRILITTLPSSPVTSAVVTNTTHTTGSRNQPVSFPATGQHWYISSLDGHDHHIELQAPTPPTGWSIDPGSAQIHIESSVEMKSQPYFSTLDQHGLAVHVDTTSCRVGPFGSCGTGRIQLYVTYDLVQAFDIPNVTTTKVVLGWGDTRTFTVTRNEWRVDVGLFNGSTLQVGPPGETSNPYLKIEDAGTTVRISTAPPNAVAAI